MKDYSAKFTTDAFAHYVGRDIPATQPHQFDIAINGSHNGGIVVAKGNTILEIVEFERFFNYKNSGLAQYKVPRSEYIIDYFKLVRDYLMQKYGIQQFHNCFYQNSDAIVDDQRLRLQDHIPAERHYDCLHHHSHAAGTFYQSPYKEALIVSLDGGGSDGVFRVYTCRRGEEPKFIYGTALDLGFCYMLLGEYLGDIKREPALSDGNLVYSGKIMGLVSYGKVRNEWLDAFKKYYKSCPTGGTYPPIIQELGEMIGVEFNTENRLYGEVAYDLAATSQRAFEDVLLETIQPALETYPNLPVCLSGGCALNILFNTRLQKEYKREVFVGPNPNDCGIALGMMLNHIRPEKPFDSTYMGIPLLDVNMLPLYLQEGTGYNLERATIQRLAQLIVDGKIIGVARGRSEHGPRALGNRSIICNPMIPDMKDILNEKVKHREWYRPFAPVVRLQDVSKYFEWEGDTRWMSFAPLVREEYRKVLPSITHIDNTARVQTVTREQNAFLYDLITEIERHTGIGVLLNTSFNDDGKPILSTVRDALKILSNSQMDGVLIERTLILKP